MNTADRKSGNASRHAIDVAASVDAEVGIIVIGRNEGERLKRCLEALDGGFNVYVDSGSTDGSQALARGRGVRVIDLAVPPKFTAARARNTGLAALLETTPGLRYVQMVDGDCILEPGWIDAGIDALRRDPGLAGVFGRLTEVAPERSLYNRLCDMEWDVPVGPTATTGGNALFRVAALVQVGGYAEDLIAGEEPDLCLRMTLAGGWRFARIDHAMARHDAAITRFRQWWQRSQRGGYAAAEHVARHGAVALATDRAQIRRMLFWGLGLPTAAIASLALSTWHVAFLALTTVVVTIYVAQTLRLARRERNLFPIGRQAVMSGGLRVLYQFAALTGFLRQRVDRARRRDRPIIEYK